MARAQITDDGKLRLKRTDRLALYGGEHPSLSFSKQVSPQTFELSTNLRLHLTGCKLHKDAWVASYVLEDNRPRHLRLKSTTALPSVLPDGRADFEDVSMPEPERIDRETEDAFAAKSHAQWADLRLVEEQRRQEKALRERIKSVMRDLSSEGRVLLLAAIEREIQRALHFERNRAA